MTKLVLKSGPLTTGTKLLTEDGVDLMPLLNAQKIEVLPLKPQSLVELRFTVFVDELELAVDSEQIVLRYEDPEA